MTTNKYSIKQRREYIKDIIKEAKPNSHTLLVYHYEHDLILMQKAFTPSLKRKAAAKNFTLEFALHTA
ncbi:hypothetical protein BCD64_11950 [Nostoc sp. MBR 210]|nr:hypothetical protein BCD64_11950 [Nostoc sp. MBR 210]